MKSTKNNKRFYLEVSYFENKNQHEIRESWICKSQKEFKKILSETLDILTIDKNGKDIPVQTFDEVRKNLEQFADEKFIKKEYKRLKKNHKIYDELVKCAEKFKVNDQIEKTVNPKTVIWLKRVN